MIDCLNRLLHHPIIGRHHKNHQVGYLGATGPHGRKSLMARGVQEDHLTCIQLHIVSTDMLGDTSCLPLGNIGLADNVKQ